MPGIGPTRNRRTMRASLAPRGLPLGVEVLRRHRTRARLAAQKPRRVPLQELVRGRFDAVEATEHDHFTVEEVGLDRRRSLHQALPRRTTDEGVALREVEAHCFRTLLVVGYPF